MENRIDRKGDESLYQPKIHSERIKTLYNLKQITGKPMTVLLDLAIRDFAERYGVEHHFDDNPVMANAEEETWEEYREYREHLDQLEYEKCLVKIEEIIREQKHEGNRI